MAQQKAPEAVQSPSKAKSVEYVGFAREVKVRELTAADFKKAGVEDQGKVVWDRSNQWTVSAEDLNADALALLARQPDFKINEG